MRDKKIVTILSGGLDSVTLLHEMNYTGYRQLAVSFNYQQRHKKELEYARRNCEKLNLPMYQVDLVLPFFNNSLTGDVEVPDGHYAEESMKATVVPNRNAIMLAIAWGVAVDVGAEAVAYAAHGGDHFIYPDCRQDFIGKIEKAFQSGSDTEIKLLAPFTGIDKAGIVRLGVERGVDFGNTWSCYKGGEVHCGKCGTCNERIEAFQLAGVEDPTIYEEER